jgi:hypothetical protein
MVGGGSVSRWFQGVLLSGPGQKRRSSGQAAHTGEQRTEVGEWNWR